MTSLNIGANRDFRVTVLKARERAIRRVDTSLFPPDFRSEFAPEGDAPS